MIKAEIRHRNFLYRRPATTSRGTYTQKSVSYILLHDDADPSVLGVGECSLFPGLSLDDVHDFTKKLKAVVDEINRGEFDFEKPLYDLPSIQFAIETALIDLRNGGKRLLFPTAFTEGENSILINGLIWMADRSDMEKQIEDKLEQGFSCLKMKVGALDFEQEFEVLSQIRKKYPPEKLELRVDANGAFSPQEAPEKLDRLASLSLHSIEQPIRQGQLQAMAKLCRETPLPIAFDEELIGVYPSSNKQELLYTIRPQYIVLKPGLLGGLQSCKDWIVAAKKLNIGWWITSALETNIGLNAIAQWTATLGNNVPHGLSTGALFENNIPSPLSLKGENLFYDPSKKWDLSILQNQGK